jgi:hypothetical protein
MLVGVRLRKVISTDFYLFIRWIRTGHFVRSLLVKKPGYGLQTSSGFFFGSRFILECSSRQ